MNSDDDKREADSGNGSGVPGGAGESVPGADPRHFDLRSFGRRRGRALSARQDALLRERLPLLRLPVEAHAPPELHVLFSAPVSDVWMEIGFGAAEHLIYQAEQNPEIGFIGCEPYVDGVVKAVAAIEQQALGNVRLYDDDVRDVLRWMQPGSLGQVFILFPDPWPKVRHRKRRLVNRQLFDLLSRVMRPGARLLIATDIGDYARSMHIAAQASRDQFHWTALNADDWRRRPGDWPVTRYERKAHREGRKSYFFEFIRTKADAPFTGASHSS